MRTDVKIRLAENSEGQIVKSLAGSNGFDAVEMDWSDIYPYWLVAEFEDEIIGTVQVCPSRPIGRLEMLHVIPEIKNGLRRIAVTMLLIAGVETLKSHGAQVVSGVIPFDLKSYKRFLKKRGAVSAGVGNIMLWRV